MIKILFLKKSNTKWIFWVVFTMLFVRCTCAQQSSPSTNSQPADVPVMRADTPSAGLFFCTTRIEAKSADGKQTGTGTGFIFSYPIESEDSISSNQTRILFIVTCKHVVNNFASATFSFVQSKDGKPDLGQKCGVVVPDLQSMVFYDPDPKVDVALIPFVPILENFIAHGQMPYFQALGKNLIPSREAAEDLSAIQPIVFVGYPYGMHDEINLLPLARRGFTASPYVVDFNGLPLFLIDANVFPGSSGSPVLVLDEGSYPSANGLRAGNRAYFLGLISQSYFYTKEGVIQFKPIPTQLVPVYEEHQYFNLGAVIKAKAILSTITKFLKVLSIPNSKP